MKAERETSGPQWSVGRRRASTRDTESDSYYKTQEIYGRHITFDSRSNLTACEHRCTASGGSIDDERGERILKFLAKGATLDGMMTWGQEGGVDR